VDQTGGGERGLKLLAELAADCTRCTLFTPARQYRRDARRGGDGSGIGLRIPPVRSAVGRATRPWRHLMTFITYTPARTARVDPAVPSRPRLVGPVD
jgi:hypothetical protein